MSERFILRNEMDDKRNILRKFSSDYSFGYRRTRKGSHKLLWISFILIVIAMIWAYLANIEEVTVSQGKVIPSKQILVIQNLEGGIVKDILVHPGQIVNKDQVLAYLDPTRFQTEYDKTQQKESALKIKIARLLAQIQQKPFNLPQNIFNSQPELSSSEETLYQTQLENLQVLNHRRDLVQKEINMTQPLIKAGDVSQVELLHLQESLADIENQILTLKTHHLNELTKAKTDLSALQANSRSIQDRLMRTTMRSSVRGVVNEIYVTTIGGVIKPGNHFMDIVPLDDTLLIEAKVRPSDIGLIHPGQQTMVKITAYDYSIYGGLVGYVEHISASAIKDEKNENFYQIRIRTKQNYLKSKEGKPLYIMPGMTASVDILTGHKTVLDNVLKPILKLKQTAFVRKITAAIEH